MLNDQSQNNYQIKTLVLVALFSLISACGGSSSDTGNQASSSGQGNIEIDSTQRKAIFTTVGQQLDDFVVFDQLDGQRPLSALAPDWFRIHAGADNDILPEPTPHDGQKKWDFSALNRLVEIAYDAHATPIMNVRHAPVSLSSCQVFHSSIGTLNDPSFGEFADYMAALVAYYNIGSFSDASGTYINPRGTAHRIQYWELWNEPELPYEFPCLRLNSSRASLSESEFATMWAITTQRMHKVDPSIKFVGPTVSDPRNLTYLDAVYHLPLPPDVISFHGYAGPNTAQDKELQKGGGDAIGINGISLAIEHLLVALDARGFSSIPILLDEYNVSPDGDDDPFKRGWNNFGVALGGSLFIKNTKLSTVHPIGFIPFQFVEVGAQRLSAINPQTGAPMLPYWRDLLLRQAVQKGDSMLKTVVTSSHVDVLATVRASQSSIQVLIANSDVTAAGVGTQGENTSITLNIAKLLGKPPKSIVLRVIDATTNPISGPNQLTLDPTVNPQINFKGYGLALVELKY